MDDEIYEPCDYSIWVIMFVSKSMALLASLVTSLFIRKISYSAIVFLVTSYLIVSFIHTTTLNDVYASSKENKVNEKLLRGDRKKIIRYLLGFCPILNEFFTFRLANLAFTHFSELKQQTVRRTEGRDILLSATADIRCNISFNQKISEFDMAVSINSMIRKIEEWIDKNSDNEHSIIVQKSLDAIFESAEIASVENKLHTEMLQMMQKNLTELHMMTKDIDSYTKKMIEEQLEADKPVAIEAQEKLNSTLKSIRSDIKNKNAVFIDKTLPQQ